MNLTYIFLLFSVISCFVGRQLKISLIFMGIATLMALFQGIINFYGLAFILLFYGISFIYFHYDVLDQWKKSILLILIIFLSAASFFHILPGFHNTLALDKMSLSPLSTPFSIYLNFDKTIMSLILFLNSPLYQSEKPLTLQTGLQTIIVLLAGALVLMSLALFSGSIKFDVKLPDIFMLWSLNNLFFVCFAEETLFRGFIQKQLKCAFKNMNLPYFHLLFASFLFGLAHFREGIPFILFASIAGLFYGFIYEKTNRILCAMFVHFGINLIHFIFFTYPSATQTIL